MHDIITIGSATVDIFMKSKDFHLQPSDTGVLLCQTYGGKLDVDDFELQSGGAGTNTAVGFRRMGFHTASVAEIGQDFFAQIIWDELQREKVDTQFLVAEKMERTAVSTLLISAEGGRSALTYRGAASMLEARDMPWEALTHTRWIHLSNVGGNPELLAQLFESVKKNMAGLSWNPGQKELALLADGHLVVESIPCDILLVNAEEWAVVEKVQPRLLAHIPTVIVSNGKKGGTIYLKGAYAHQYKIKTVPIVQETGAGDAFGVGFISGHLLGMDVPMCCEWGAKNAASVVQHMGAKTGLLDRKDFGLVAVGRNEVR